jgi:hypothetical protein
MPPARRVIRTRRRPPRVRRPFRRPSGPGRIPSHRCPTPRRTRPAGWRCEQAGHAGAKRTALNLNVPALPTDEVDELRWATLDEFGSVRAAVESVEGSLQFEFRATEAELDPDSDTALLAAGHPTVTALGGLAMVPPGTVVTGPEEIVQRLAVT